MSEQEKRTSSTSTVVATAIVAALAVAAIIVLIVMNVSASDPKHRLPDGTEVTFRPTQEFVNECGEHAQELVAANYRVVRLYISEGLPHLDEPYGNRPEDGLYTASSNEFRTYEEVEALVRSTYTEAEANRILTGMPSDPSGKSDTSDSSASSRPQLVAVYASREIYVDRSELYNDVSVPKVPEVVIPPTNGEASYVKKSVLGISEYFVPYTEYKKPWGSTSIKIVPVSEDECRLTIYLGADRDVDLSSVEDTDILSTEMVKINGEWRLSDLVF